MVRLQSLLPVFVILRIAFGFVPVSRLVHRLHSRVALNAGNGAIARYFELKVPTLKGISFHDLSADIQRCIDESGVKEGTVNVYSRHTTTAITINEMESRLMNLQSREPYCFYYGII